MFDLYSFTGHFQFYGKAEISFTHHPPFKGVGKTIKLDKSGPEAVKVERTARGVVAQYGEGALHTEQRENGGIR